MLTAVVLFFSGPVAWAIDAQLFNGTSNQSLYVYYDTDSVALGGSVNVYVSGSVSGDTYHFGGDYNRWWTGGNGNYSFNPNGSWGYGLGGEGSIDRWMTITPNEEGSFQVGLMFASYPNIEQAHAYIDFYAYSTTAAITSATSVNRNQGDAPSYQITATNSPTSFSATNLPSGTSLNTSTGVISGRVNPSGTIVSTISASNSSGGETVNLTWNITAASIANSSYVSSSLIANGSSVNIVRSGSTNFTFGWTEVVVWQPNGSPVVLSNAGYTTTSYTPTGGPGLYSLQIRVADVYGNYVDKSPWPTFRVNAAPVPQSVSATNTTMGSATSITARATDVDGNLANLHFYITGPAYSDTYVGSTAATNGSDSTVTASWTPSAAGSYAVRLGASDGLNVYYSGSAVSASFTVAGPTNPTNLSSTTTGSSFVALGWSASTVSGATIAGYEVYRNGVKISGTSLVTGTTYTDNGANPSTSYAYTVRAKDSAGNYSGYSTAANVTTAVSFEVLTPTP